MQFSKLVLFKRCEMSKKEVIKRLKDHLQGKLSRNNRICKDDKCYCINYIMDFLFCDRETATHILENEILV